MLFRPQHILSALAVGGLILAASSASSKGGSPASGQPLFNSLDQFVLFAEEEIKLEQGVQVSSGDLGSNSKLESRRK